MILTHFRLIGLVRFLKELRDIILSIPQTFGQRQRQLLSTPRAIVLMSLLLVIEITAGQDPAHPLMPPDRSSPRAALKTFLDSGDAIGDFVAKVYMFSPTRAKFHRMVSLGEEALEGLDLSEVPPAARVKTGRSAAIALYTTLSRIQLPPFDEIPGAEQVGQPGTTNVVRWVVPHTEIVLQRVPHGRRGHEFLFSPDTVARAEEFYNRVRELPYVRAVPQPNLKELGSVGGGWMVPHTWVQSLPWWLQAPVLGQALWKWFALTLILFFFLLFLRLTYRLSHRGSSEHPFKQALTQSLLPASLLLATPVITYLALVQLNLAGTVGSIVELISTAVVFLAAAWLVWRAAPVLAEAIISSPHISPESIDAHLIRICTRLLGIIGGGGLLAMGADRLGLPLYGIIAGLGVGGLAIALAAQPTIENLIGGLSLFADKPIRVGDFCRYGDEVGTVEAIGIRSTRIRGLDRTLTTIPNAVLSKMPVVNFTLRDRVQMKCVIGIRYETSADQLRFLLTKLQQVLAAHPRIRPDTVRVRLTGFGPSAHEVELVGHAMTRDWSEFLTIQQEILLKVIDVVKESGTSFAFPSQTIYFTRDDGLDTEQTKSAEEQARGWRDQGSPALANLSPGGTARTPAADQPPPAKASPGARQ